MRKKLINKSKATWCPFSQEECKKEECMQYYKPFEKCNLEIIGYNLFKVSKSIDDLLEELKTQ